MTKEEELWFLANDWHWTLICVINAAGKQDVIFHSRIDGCLIPEPYRRLPLAWGVEA
jgi:hypothetical protein